MSRSIPMRDCAIRRRRSRSTRAAGRARPPPVVGGFSPGGGRGAPPPRSKPPRAGGPPPPLRATDGRGRDVLEQIRSLDRHYVEGFDVSPIRGYAASHELTLDLGPGGD